MFWKQPTRVEYPRRKILAEKKSKKNATLDQGTFNDPNVSSLLKAKAK